MDRIFEFLQEDNGGFSMARLIVFMMAALYFYQGASQIYHTGQMTTSWTDVVGIMGPFFIKSYQKNSEQKVIPTVTPQ